MNHYLFKCAFLVSLVASTHVADAEDLVVADFESDSYEGWMVTGEAFGPGPAKGTLDRQNPVSGYEGNRLVNTFWRGDKTIGTATSAKFVIQRSHIAFLIGGGAHQESVGVELLVDGESVRQSTGAESETLEWKSWDVTKLRGQSAQIRIFDNATGGWGHINVDQIIQTDEPPKPFGLQRRLAEYRDTANYMNEL